MPRELIEAFSESGTARWRRPLIEQLAQHRVSRWWGAVAHEMRLHTRHTNTNVWPVSSLAPSPTPNRIASDAFDKFYRERILYR